MAYRELAWLFLEPDTGLDHCPRILLSCFRARISAFVRPATEAIATSLLGLTMPTRPRPSFSFVLPRPAVHGRHKSSLVHLHHMSLRGEFLRTSLRWHHSIMYPASLSNLGGSTPDIGCPFGFVFLPPRSPSNGSGLVLRDVWSGARRP